MFHRAWSMTCLLLAQYEGRFQPTIVYFDVNSGQYEPEFDCVNNRSHLTAQSLKYLLELIKASFRFQRKFVIIATETASVHLMNNQHVPQGYEAFSGFSRWFLHFPKLSRGLELSEVFQCFSIFVNDTLANIPSDFVKCNQRRYVSASQVGEVEKFTRKPQKFVCSAKCFERLTRNGVKTNYAIKWLDFLEASNFSDNPRVEYIDREGQAEIAEEARLLGTRRKDFSFSPLIVTYPRTASMTYTAPTVFAYYNIFIKRRFHRISRDDRLLRLFSGWTWFALCSFTLLQVMSVVVLYRRRFSDTALFLCALLLGQSGQRLLEVSRGLLSTMLVAGFVLASAYRNNLTSTFNVPSLLTFNEVDDLRQGFKEHLLRKVCVNRNEFVFSAADSESRDPLLKVLGEFKEKENLLGYGSSEDCVDHLIAQPQTAAVLFPGFIQIRKMSVLNVLRIGRPIPTSLFGSYILPPWSPHEKTLRRISRSILEANLLEVETLIWTSNAASKIDSAERLHVLDLVDFKSVFFSLSCGFIFSCVASLFELSKPRSLITASHRYS